MNRVFLLGHVGQDPEIRATKGGTVTANFSLATSERVKKGEKWEDATEWHNVCAVARTAEIIRDYVKKGSKLLIEGKLQTRKWDDKKTGATHYKTEVFIRDLTLMGDGGKAAKGSVSDDVGITDDDIPF